MLNVTIDRFSYNKTPILKGIKFQLEEGTRLSVLGESGCGKSTLLKLIYGTLQLKQGALSWKDQKLLGPDYNLLPGEDFIKMVAQDFDLMPYTSVSENIGKHLSRLDMLKRNSRIQTLLDVVEMTSLKDHKVKTLSGGQQQRVALARALANEPELLLLDEPFSHIDNFRKNKLRRRLYSYLKSENITCITATHDSEEALSFSDVIKIMKAGQFVAEGRPESIYQNTSDFYVASFFEDVFQYKRELYYPHQITISKDGQLQATVKTNYFKGQFWLIEATFKGNAIFFQHTEKFEIGQTVHLKLNRA